MGRFHKYEGKKDNGPEVPEYLKSAFSAPRICSVEEGTLAKFVRLPAWEIKRAATTSPIKEVKFGAISFILVTR